MSKFVAQFIEELAGVAGVELTPEQKDMLKTKEFSGILPEDFANSVKAKIANRDALMHDPEVKKRMFGQALGTLETRLRQSAKEIGFKDEDIASVWGGNDKSAIDVLPNLMKATLERGLRMGESNAGLNVEELRKKVEQDLKTSYEDRVRKNSETIRELQAQVENLSAKEQKIHQEWEGKLNRYKVETALSQKVSSLPWRKDFGSAADILKKTAVQNLAGAFVWKEEGGELVPFTIEDPALRATRDGKMLKADDVILPVVAEWLDKGGNGSGAPPANGNRRTPEPPPARNTTPAVKRPDFTS